MRVPIPIFVTLSWLVCGLGCQPRVASPPPTATAAAAAGQQPPVASQPDQGKTMFECTKQLTPDCNLAEELANAPAGAILCLEPGRYPGGLRFTRSVTLRGQGRTAEIVLDAAEAARVLEVVDDDVQVTLEQLTLTGGNAKAGGGLAVEGFAEVTLRQCVFQGNRARGSGGGAVYATAGRLTLEDCILQGNQAGEGQALYADQVAVVTLRRTVATGLTDQSSPLLTIRDGAEVTLDSCVLTATAPEQLAVSTSGSTSRAPTLRIRQSALKGGLDNDPAHPARVKLEQVVLNGSLRGPADQVHVLQQSP